MDEVGLPMIGGEPAGPIARPRADGVDASARVHQSAEVEDGVSVGPDTTVWGLSHLRAGAVGAPNARSAVASSSTRTSCWGTA